jgi:threonine/homoserine/homoserine lactone efflux protein
MHDALTSLLLLAGIYLAVLASPGPNFFILGQMALDGQRRQAHWAVHGITTSSVVRVNVTLTSLAALMAARPGLDTTLCMLGAACLRAERLVNGLSGGILLGLGGR